METATGLVYRFAFKCSIPPNEIEENLALATVLAEALLGKTTVRLGHAYYQDIKKNVLIIDRSTEAGEFIALLFGALCLKQFGDLSFHVQRIPPVETAAKEKTL